MANNLKLSQQAANTAADRVCALLNSGKLILYDGSQPASADTPVTTQNKLAELSFGSPAFGPASGGVATANSIATTSAITGGVATWFRVTRPDGSAVFDGSVGTGTADLVMNATQLQAGAAVAVPSFAFTQPTS